MRTPAAAIAFLACGAAAGLAGCAATDDPRAAGAAWIAVTDTIGDTVVVRTLSGSDGGDGALVPELTIGVLDGPPEYTFGQIVSLAAAPDGSLFLYDSHARELRRYGADGRFLDVFGREGGGPGEYRRPDGGLAVLSDGRVVIRDPGNARISVFAPDGRFLEAWPIRGGFSTSRPLFTDRTDQVYHTVLLDPEADMREWRNGLLRFDPSGRELDTLPAPETGFRGARIEAASENSRNINTVPFTATERWTFSPDGHFVHGISTRYAIDLLKHEGTLRIEREVEPVPVQAEERRNAEERAIWNMRSVDPGWRWNGPAIPDRKPPFRDILVGGDGRIWVAVSTTGERIPPELVEERGSGERPPPMRWREPVAFDVFEPDGSFLGRARAPVGFSLYPTPAIRGDTVWAVVRDDLDVPTVVRLRLHLDPRTAGAG